MIQPGTGKRGALAGCKARTSDIIVTMDGERSSSDSKLVRFAAALVAAAACVKGARFTSSGGSDDITPSRHFGNRVLSGVVNGKPGSW